MKIENKEKYTLISSTEVLFSKFHDNFLEALPSLENQNLILHISDSINVTRDNFSLYLSISEQKKENGTSFVVIYKTINIDDLPDNFNIVPTLIEAEDILEMEAMERELGF
jgi:hypothetical protein